MAQKKVKACWSGYEAIGFKMKGSKRVPNCVPTNKKKNQKRRNKDKMGTIPNSSCNQKGEAVMASPFFVDN